MLLTFRRACKSLMTYPCETPLHHQQMAQLLHDGFGQVVHVIEDEVLRVELLDRFGLDADAHQSHTRLLDLLDGLLQMRVEVATTSGGATGVFTSNSTSSR